jgi:NAD(P)-dependent dehydrogenase (short-subunit alcohol dehydrogenase family)
MVHRLDAKVAPYVTRLKKKLAIVTGGRTGIGRAIALAYAREGAKVAVLGRHREPLDEVVEVVKEIAALGSQGLPIVCDVTRSDEVKQAVGELDQTFGRLNLRGREGSRHRNKPERPFLLSRVVLPVFRRAGGGAIVNVGSVLGLVTSTLKGGLALLTKAIALDHAQKNQVNGICPTIVQTELVRGLFDQSHRGRMARDTRIGTLPLGRFGQPQAVELAESSWITGTAIPLDGGLSAYGRSADRCQRN